MPKRLTKFLNGLVLIERFNMTASEEIEWFNRLNGVNLFPSANYRSQRRNRKGVSSGTDDVSTGESHDREK